MKRTKQTATWSLLLACAAVMALAGCSDSKTSDGKASDKSAAAANSPAKRGNISVMVYDRGRVPAEEGTYEKNRWTDWINKNDPVDVKYVPIPRVKPEEKLNVLFASGSAPDLILEYGSENRNSWYTSKQIQPIGDAIEKYSKEYKEQLNKYPILRKLGTRSDGKLYDVGFVTKLDINWVYLVRADWLRKLNMSAPQTIDDLYKTAKAMTEQDPDGNGKRDTYGMGLSNFNKNIVNFMFGNPTFGYHVPKDGSLENGWDNMRASTEFMKKLFQDGIIDKDFIADGNGEKLKRDFVNGKVGFYVAQQNDLKGLLDALLKNDPTAELVPIVLPKTPFGQFSPPISVPAQVPGVVNATAKDLESIVRYIDFLSQEKTVKTLKWGIEGEHYKLDEKSCPKPISVEKNTKELAWNIDYHTQLSTQDWIKDCDVLLGALNPDNKVDNAYKAIVEAARKLYLTAERPIPGFTSEAYVPSIPSDLKLILDSFKTDELMKSIVTPDYTPEKAVQNLKDTWSKAGGGKIDEWYKNWYKDNKDKAILLKDIYEIKQ